MEYGGLFFALPALLVNGLLLAINKYFPTIKGYYSVRYILISLAYLMLLRQPSIERVRYLPVGELGRLIGLDRIPG